MELLKFGKKMYESTDGQVNIGLWGSAFSLAWTRGRRELPIRNGPLFPMMRLYWKRRSTVISRSCFRRREFYRVFKDPALRLDVGGIAKGWAVERVAEYFWKRNGAKSYLLNIGGNLRAIGKRGDGTKWVVQYRIPSI